MVAGRLKGKVAVITGATSGIGYGTARAFVKEGATVIFNARSAGNGAEVEEMLRAIAAGGQVRFVQADVSLREEIEGVIDLTLRDFGRLDALVNNAQGIPPLRAIERKPDEDYRYSFDSGFFASKWAMQRALPAMRDQGGGSIVNTTSGWATYGAPNGCDYSANKAALEALTRTAAQEWGRYNINVNIVAPSAASAGYVNWKRANPELAAETERTKPLARAGDPELDLGMLALGLVTEEARFITAQTFDGGGGNIYLRHAYTGTDEMEALDVQSKD